MRYASAVLLLAGLALGMLFFDDFSSGGDEGWQRFGSAGFQVINQEYYIHAGGDRGAGASFNGDDAGTMSTPDYSVMCRLLIEAGTEAGVLCRFTGEDDWCYALSVRPQNGLLVLQRRRLNGIRLTLDEASVPVEYGFTHWIRLQVEGDLIRGRIWTGSPEDEPGIWHVSATDGVQIYPGAFGLFAAGYGKVPWSTSFDDVAVSEPLGEGFSTVTWASVKMLEF
jgi:hypothetical protein